MRKKTIFAIVVTFLMVSLAGDASAFDGEKNGFILGIGIGPGEASYNVLVTNFKIGAGITEHLQLYWSAKTSWQKVGSPSFDDRMTRTVGVAGLGFSYYVSPTQPTMYVTGSLGFSAVSFPFESDIDSDIGLGTSMGFGYEFTPHYSIEAVLVSGTVISSRLQVTLNVLAY